MPSFTESVRLVRRPSLSRSTVAHLSVSIIARTYECFARYCTGGSLRPKVPRCFDGALVSANGCEILCERSPNEPDSICLGWKIFRFATHLGDQDYFP